MYCPFCHAVETKVINSRLVNAGSQVRRRRECVSCQERFTTYESVELSLPRLIKKDGSFVSFQVTKLRAGILRATEKRPIALEDIDHLIEKIVHKLQVCTDREVTTHILGELVMNELKTLDDVAYVRFASVYKQFEDIEAFSTAIKSLKDKEIC